MRYSLKQLTQSSQLERCQAYLRRMRDGHDFRPSPHFLRKRPGREETPDSLKQYFTNCVCNNLHIVLCMSPMNLKLPTWARKLLGLISNLTIDWPLPLPLPPPLFLAGLVGGWLSCGIVSRWCGNKSPPMALAKKLLANAGASLGMELSIL